MSQSGEVRKIRESYEFRERSELPRGQKERLEHSLTSRGNPNRRKYSMFFYEKEMSLQGKKKENPNSHCGNSDRKMTSARFEKSLTLVCEKYIAKKPTGRHHTGQG